MEETEISSITDCVHIEGYEPEDEISTLIADDCVIIEMFAEFVKKYPVVDLPPNQPDIQS